MVTTEFWNEKARDAVHVILYRKKTQLHLFIGDIISSLLSNGESLSLHEKLILPPTQTWDRQKPHQNCAEADAMLRKPSSNLR